MRLDDNKIKIVRNQTETRPPTAHRPISTAGHATPMGRRCLDADTVAKPVGAKKSYSLADRQKLKTKFTYLKSIWMDSGAVFVINALDKFNKHACLDDCHYSAEASELIAREISKNPAAKSSP